MNKRILAGILSLTMCASAISSGNAGLFAGAEGQNNEPSDSSPKETTDGNHSLPESSDITEEPEIPLKPVFHSIPDDTEIYESVSLGENISADVYSNGLLRIYGYGEMRNFNSSPFVNAAAITQILFEDTDASNGLFISNIGNNVFKGMYQLHASSYGDITKAESGVFVLPKNVTAVGSSAFANCSGLIKMIVPESVTSMDNSIFTGCTSLKELTIPFAATSKNVADGAVVGYYNSVSDLFISPGWDLTNNDADYSGYSIRKITVTGGDIIPDYAFSNMKTLEEVDFSSSKVSSVGNYAFNGCTALATVKLSKTVTSLGNYSFCGTSITALPDNGHITSVGSYAFSDCINLSDITIPETYQTFGDGVFRNCIGITKLSLPSGTLSTGCEIFKGCTSLEELTLPFAATSKDVADGADVGYYNSVSDLFVSPGWDLANNGADYFGYSIRKITVTGGDIIPDYAFSNMKTLEEVDFSSSKVSSVGNYAFNGCTALKSIKISDSLKTINQYAFLNCSEIKKFNLPNGLESIYNNAFQNCTGINGFSVPDTVTSMGCEIFKGCTSLEELTLPFAATSKDVADGAGVGYYNSVSDLFVSPSWDQANNGADYSGYSIRKITVTGGARIPDYAFSNMKTLEEVTICNSDITQINPYAFNSCTSLKKIDIPENISSISSNAFANCNADIFVYNNSCTIADNTVSKDYSGTIHGFDGSTADDYADSHGYTFKAFDKELVKGTRNISMFPGDKYTVKSDYTDISFSSSDKTIASVNKNGVITALKPGNAVIEVKSGSDRSTGINVIVKTPVIETTTAVTTAESTTSQTTSATPAVTTVQETTAPAVTTVPDTVNSDTTTSAVTTTAKVTTVTSPAVTTTTSKTEVTTTTKTQTTTTSKPAETTTTTKISTTPAPAETTVPSASETSNTTKVTTVPPVVSSVSTTKTTTAASTAAVTEATTTTVTDPVPPEPRRLDIDGKMTVREMSYDDIQNSSIDISDPSNYHVYEYEIKATFDAEIIKIDKYVPKDPHGEGDELVCGFCNIRIDNKPATLIDYRVTATEEMYMFVRGECKWLKEFYDVELIVINKDDKNESLTDCYAKLNVPDGLTLANCEQEQKLDTLKAGEAFDVHWYVRGDKAGDYDLTSVFRGKNRGEEFTYNFKSQNTLHVYAKNALKMEIRLPRYSFFDKDYPIEISFKNISDKPIYNIEQTINSYKQSTKLNVKKYLNGKLISEHTSYKTLQKGDLRQTYQLGELGPNEEFVAVVTIHDIWRSLLEQIVGDLKIGSDLAALITCCSANPDLQSVNLISSCYRHYLNSIEIAHVLKSVDVTPLPNSTVELLPNIVIIDNSDEVIRNIISRVACDGVSNGIYSALTTGCSSGGSSYTDYTLGGIGSGLATLGEDIYYRIYSPAGGANVIFYVLDANGSVKPAPKAGVNTLNGSVYDNFKIEVLDGEYSIDEKGNYVFETDASVKITPLKSGVKAIIGAESEDGTENISETIEVVDEHECKGEYTVLSGPDNEYGAFRLSLCETCGSLIDCAEMPKSATAMFDNGECYQDIRSALEDAAKSDEEAKLYIFGNVVIPEDVTVPENITLILVPDTKLSVTGDSKFIVKGEVKDFSGYDYNFENGCFVQKASEETDVTEITVTEPTAAEAATTDIPETTGTETTVTTVPDTTATETDVTTTPETTVAETDVTTALETTTTAGTTKTSDSSKAEDSVYSAIKELAKCALKVLKNLFKGFFG